MERRIKNWWLIKLALTIAGKTILGEMTRASKNGKKSQAKILWKILTASKDTVYGKEHHFDEILKAKTPEELFSLYQKYVPVNQYEDFIPYIERHKNGESDILFPGKPMFYATTSGTTKIPKWIPISKEYYQVVYKKMSRGLFYTLMRSKPKVFYGPGVSIVSKAVEGRAPDGTIYGSTSGITHRDIPKFMKVLHTAPSEVFHIDDYKARYYAIMRMGIERDTHLIVCLNPSTIVELQTNANEFFDDYCDDIEHGTVGRKLPIPDEIRSVLEAYTKPNPTRAAELRALKKQHGTVLPKHYWPNMQTVNVWFCGNTKIYFDKIKDSFAPDCEFYEFGFSASECRPGLVLKSNTPETTLFGHMIYFEFIHESDLEKPNPRIWQAYELEPGQRYCFIITTCAGLYRYNMNDLLEITGFYNQFPTFKFIQKVNGTVSLTGEKLHERQVIEAVKIAEKHTDKRVSFYIGFANPEESNYTFYYEFADQNTTMAEAKAFTFCLDSILQEFNSEYRDKRASNRVKAPETALLGPESFERFKQECINLGYRDGQFKLNLLLQDKKKQAMFQKLVK